MKATLFLLLIALLSISCNDNDVAPTTEPKTALLTRVSRNGLTTLEFQYDVERKLYRVDYYYKGNLASYIVYEYDETGLKEIRKYEEVDLEPSYRIVFTLDNLGKAIKADHHFKTNLDKAVVTVAYIYNASGQLIVQDSGEPGEPLHSRKEYSYDANNNLIREETSYHPDQEEEYLNSVYEYTPGDQTIPDAWQNYVFPLMSFGFDETVQDMFNIKKTLKAWDSSGELEFESITEMSDQVFDDDGNIIRQVTTWKDVLHSDNAAIVYNMIYEYTPED